MVHVVVSSNQHNHLYLSKIMQDPDSSTSSSSPGSRKSFPHQSECVELIVQAHRNKKSGFIVVHEMGLGKTWTLLRCIQEIVPADGKSLIICPKATLDHWVEEYECLHGETDRVQIYHGVNRVLSAAVSLVITTEATLLYEMKKRVNSKIWNTVFDFMVIDEAHLYANIVPRGVRAPGASPKYCKLFQKIQRKFTVPMTGTPFKNHHSDVQSLLALAGLGPDAKCLKLQEVVDLFSKHSHRANAAEVKDMLPIVTHNTIDIAYATKEIAVKAKSLLLDYKLNVALAQSYTASGRPIPPPVFAKLMESLSKARIHDVLMVERVESIAASYNVKRNLKMQRLIDTLRSTQKGNKVVIVSYFVTVLRVLQQVIEQELNVRGLLYTGDMSFKELCNAKKLFKLSPDEGGNDIFLLSKSCGGCGLNLKANRMIIFEPNMNHAGDNQVKSRVVRLGQTHGVSIDYYKHPEMDTYIWNLKQNKLAITSLFIPDEKRSLSAVFDCDTKAAEEIIRNAHKRDEDKEKKQNKTKKRKLQQASDPSADSDQKVSNKTFVTRGNQLMAISRSLENKGRKTVTKTKKRKNGYQSALMRQIRQDCNKIRRFTKL